MSWKEWKFRDVPLAEPDHFAYTLKVLTGRTRRVEGSVGTQLPRHSSHSGEGQPPGSPCIA